MYVYKQTEFGEYPLWTVGHYTPDGDWIPEFDGTKDECFQRVITLNGGINDEIKYQLIQIHDYLSIFHKEGIKTY